MWTNSRNGNIFWNLVTCFGIYWQIVLKCKHFLNVQNLLWVCEQFIKMAGFFVKEKNKNKEKRKKETETKKWTRKRNRKGPSRSSQTRKTGWESSRSFTKSELASDANVVYGPAQLVAPLCDRPTLWRRERQVGFSRK